MHKFRAGDQIKFVSNNGFVPSYFTSEVPEELIMHGRIVYKKNEGTVIDVLHPSGIVLVRYIDDENKTVQLGFNAKDLILVKHAASRLKIKIQYLSKDGSSKKVELIADSKEDAISKIEDLERIEFMMEEAVDVIIASSHTAVQNTDTHQLLISDNVARILENMKEDLAKVISTYI